MILSPYFRLVFLIPVVFILAINIRMSFDLNHLIRHDKESDDLMHGPPTKSPPGAKQRVKHGDTEETHHSNDSNNDHDAAEPADSNEKDSDDITSEDIPSYDEDKEPPHEDEKPNNEEERDAADTTSKNVPTSKQQSDNNIGSIDDDKENTFAACLQIMDDNHFLIEWLAYHYHVMPLRRLIVLEDPHSHSSPEPILNRWKDRINITLWHEIDVYPDGIPPPPDPKKKTTKLGEHRARQRRFLRTCLRTLHDEKRSWVVLTDTDEYTLINERIRNATDPISPLKYAPHKQLQIPSQQEPGSVMKALKMKDLIIPHTRQLVHNNPCITMARKTFGTKETDPNWKTVVGSDAHHFQTLHWRYYDKTFKPGKALLNLQRIRYDDISSNPSVHRPIVGDTICKGKLAVKEPQSVFVTNHYPGNLQQMLFRVFDARGDASNATAYRIERFKKYKRYSHLMESKNIQDWLLGFVDSVGLEEATKLLEYIGLPQEASYLSEDGSDGTTIKQQRDLAPNDESRSDETNNVDEEVEEASKDKDDVDVSASAEAAGEGGKDADANAANAEAAGEGAKDADANAAESEEESESEDLEGDNAGDEDAEEEQDSVEVPDHEPHQPLQPIASIDDPDTFAGCLQIMDDNHFLIEWLAYHYHVMPLRRLIVLMDPHSRTTPEPILERWRGKIDITLWHERDIFPNGIPPPPNKKKTPTKLGRHRVRQKKFILTCLKSLKREGRGWVVLTDTDEYTMINDRMRESLSFFAANRNVTLPSQEEPGSVMKVLKQNVAKDPVSRRKIGGIPCITMARRTFSTKEKKDQAPIHYGFTTASLQTFHWRYYSKTFKPGKALLNLKSVDYKDFPSQPSVHRPINDRSICIGKVALNEQESIFAVNHYSGNWDQMLFRDMDARGDAANATAYRIERYNNYKKIGKHMDPYRIQDWLPGFIGTVGEEEAKSLLQHVGLPNEAATFIEKVQT